jgi:hypothetical protein
MARVAIIFGLLLCGLTVAGLVSSTAKNGTQFFAMILGIPVLFLGVVALNPHRRKQSMQLTTVIAATGAIVAAIPTLLIAFRWAGGHPIDALSLKMLAAITIVSGLLLVLCLHSMLQGKRGNAADHADPGSSSSGDPRQPEDKKPELEPSGMGQE